MPYIQSIKIKFIPVWPWTRPWRTTIIAPRTLGSAGCLILLVIRTPTILPETRGLLVVLPTTGRERPRIRSWSLRRIIIIPTPAVPICHHVSEDSSLSKPKLIKIAKTTQLHILHIKKGENANHKHLINQ